VSLTYRCDEPGDRSTGIAAAVAAARRGALVVLPTETSYAVATDAFSHLGVARMREALGRTSEVPLPVLVGRAATLDGLVLGMSVPARQLIEGFWPGPLTVMLFASPTLAWDIGDTGGTVTVRMPLHPVALEVLRATGPLVATGVGAARTVDAARDALGDAVAVYLDGGECPEGLPSTVVDATDPVPRVVRPGAYPIDLLREVVPELEGESP